MATPRSRRLTELCKGNDVAAPGGACVGRPPLCHLQHTAHLELLHVADGRERVVADLQGGVRLALAQAEGGDQAAQHTLAKGEAGAHLPAQPRRRSVVQGKGSCRLGFWWGNWARSPPPRTHLTVRVALGVTSLGMVADWVPDELAGLWNRRSRGVSATLASPTPGPNVQVLQGARMRGRHARCTS